jgi:hypothetical protein
VTDGTRETILVGGLATVIDWPVESLKVSGKSVDPLLAYPVYEKKRTAVRVTNRTGILHFIMVYYIFLRTNDMSLWGRKTSFPSPET